MSDQPEGYSDAKLAINRVYTRHGDKGQTRLVGGQKVAKDDTRIEAYGTIDELGAVIGMARATLLTLAASGCEPLAELAEVLLRVQHELFNAGSILATLPEDVHPSQPRVTEADVEALERDIDERNGQLEALRSFVLAGGSLAEAQLHLARTVCRRAERCVVRLSRAVPDEVADEVADVVPSVVYLNRLSDALFVWSRWVNAKLGASETLWDPNAASSGK
jgi:cob(I)alamin adenosyltransferase